MKVFSKLQAVRVELQKQNMKKSGQNKFAGYSYFELGDFLPIANELFYRFGLCSIVSFTKEEASLRVICPEDGSEITFTSPMADANLKGTHPIQNLGAVQTYQRRYLYMVALEIVEHDALDSSEPIKPKHSAEKTDRTPVTPTAGVLAQFEEEEQNFLRELAQSVQEAYTNDVQAAINILDKKHLEAEEKIAVWSLLDSKCRSAIKKAKETTLLASQA